MARGLINRWISSPTGKFNEAEELYNSVVESMLNSPFRERSYFAIQEIARNYFRVRMHDKAEQYLKKALDSLPDLPTEAKHELQSDLTILYSEIGKHEEADKLITELKVLFILDGCLQTDTHNAQPLHSFALLRLLSLNPAISRPPRR